MHVIFFFSQRVDPAQEEGEEERETWSHPAEFILSCLGYAVGLGNVWKFPYMCFNNGGGAFLIPYAVMLVVVGVPAFFMEMSMGQYFSSGPATLWANTPLFYGMGIGMCLITSMLVIFLTMVMGYALLFMGESFRKRLPWDSCQNDFNTPMCFNKREARPCENDGGIWVNQTCYNQTYWKYANITYVCYLIMSSMYWLLGFRKGMLGLSAGIEETGEMKWELVVAFLAGWILIFICVIKGIKSSGKVVYFTAIFPYVILTILLVRGLLLEGAIDGVKYYIKPDYSKLTEPKIWADAAGQIFFSLSVGSGGLMTFSSYNKFSNNIYRDALVVSVANCLTSFYAGFAIFAILGHMAFILDREIEDVAVEGSTLAFVAYPTIVAEMPLSQLWSFLFFFMLITLALDSLFAGMETVLTAVADTFPKTRKHKTWLALGFSVLFFALGLPMCTQGGVYWLNLIAYYATGWCIILIGMLEVIIFGWIYGADHVMKYIREMTGVKLWCHWWVAWKIITPAALLVILIFNLAIFTPLAFGPYTLPTWAQALGWLMALAAPAVVVIAAIVSIVRSYYNPKFDGMSLSKVRVRSRMPLLCLIPV
ncbi:hypothetical protein CAPTEDRAFT_115534 [Capitella teleta]|uniref:Transporter n=1 Tax=Capitella teleta TaxID=283909 RepID=R7UWW6_CAPTE|nr:hypothetical protein CAPTEDRAFT_115534 [Capitella teleta]|eukprot:ELU10824.1 hypothetical protein CAPTEDRAFT_115534 [Capitella teleta]